MRQRIFWVFLVLAFTSLSVYSASSSKEAFIDITKKSFKKQYNSLAMAPLEVPAALKLPDDVKKHIEETIVKRLEKEGFEVLPPIIFQSIREHMQQLVGLSSDMQEQDLEKLTAVREHSYRELLLRHDINAIVSPRIRVVGAPFKNDKAEWDGTSQKIEHSGDGFAKFITGKKYSGTVAASSLRLTVWDRKKLLLYDWSGGIEVLMHRKAKSLEYLPAEEFWQDKKRIDKAIKNTMKPL